MAKDMNMSPAPQRKANVRLALILATVAVVFGAGFMAKIILFGR